MPVLPYWAANGPVSGAPRPSSSSATTRGAPDSPRRAFPPCARWSIPARSDIPSWPGDRLPAHSPL